MSGITKPVTEKEIRKAGLEIEINDIIKDFRNTVIDQGFKINKNGLHINNSLQKFYYLLPFEVKTIIQRKFFEEISENIKEEDFFNFEGDEITKRYKNILEKSGLIENKKPLWPHGKKFCFVLTVDYDPTPHSLRNFRLSDKLNEIPFSLGIVGKSSYKIKKSSLKKDIYLHGLTHNPDFKDWRKKDITSWLIEGKKLLKKNTTQRVKGFRSPRLSRNLEMYSCLEKSNILYSSSVPDIDLENPDYFGNGCGLHFPFFPFNSILEIPVTAPDDILPLYMGLKFSEIKKIIKKKINMIRETGGLYVHITHPGLFGNRDYKYREKLQSFIVKNIVNSEDVWITTLEGVFRRWQLLLKNFK